MTTEDRIRDRKYKILLTEKPQKLLVLSSRKIDKYEYQKGEKQATCRKSLAKTNRKTGC